MRTRFQKFLAGFTLYTLIIAIISSVIYIWVPAIPVSPAFPYIILLIYVLTVLIVMGLMKGMENKPNRFINAFMLFNFAKLFVYVIIIFIYAWQNREEAIGFILTFFAYYLVFTAYEIVVLLRLSKKSST